MRFNIAVDTGGTFTDAVVTRSDGLTALGKAATTLDVAWPGVGAAIAAAAKQFMLTTDRLLDQTDALVFGTTRATNAILEGKTAPTAFVTTNGMKDVLVFREGGKLGPFNMYQPYPEPYIPRAMTYELTERVDAEGNVIVDIDTTQAKQVIESCRSSGYEAIAVCLLNSHINGVHEQQVGELIQEHGAGIRFTLSHELNPIIREYRRASGAALDASLKPLMQEYLENLAHDLERTSFRGELLFANSQGGVMRFGETISRPLYTVRSGPALAPVAGYSLAQKALNANDVVVCDAGGTSFEVSVVRDGRVATTRQTWIGEQYTGHITGLPSVDTRSIGAGGGSIAWVDEGGLLRVGPQSAGAMPGPACYGTGGTKPTVTDAALVLGLLDPAYFLGGRQSVNPDAAMTSLQPTAKALNYSIDDTAAAILTVQTENMKSAIRRMTISEGIDPRKCLVVAGGGSAGFNILQIARELGCETVLIPRTAAALSAMGGHASDLTLERAAARFTASNNFDFTGVESTLNNLQASVNDLTRQLEHHGYRTFYQELVTEARYAHQAWELEVPLGDISEIMANGLDVTKLSAAFHTAHERVYGIAEPEHTVEFLNWRLKLVSPRSELDQELVREEGQDNTISSRDAKLPGDERRTLPVHNNITILEHGTVRGPALVEEPTTTLVVHSGWELSLGQSGTYIAKLAG